MKRKGMHIFPGTFHFYCIKNPIQAMNFIILNVIRIFCSCSMKFSSCAKKISPQSLISFHYFEIIFNIKNLSVIITGLFGRSA